MDDPPSKPPGSPGTPATPGPAGDRRAFFRQALLGGLNHLEKAGANISRRIDRLAGEPAAPQGKSQMPDPPPGPFLRPPGALPETELAATCSRCGECARACPAQCIIVDPARAGGMPHILPRQSPCVICDDLSCMKVCPTGALTLVPTIADIHMGTAVLDPATCLRSNRVDARGRSIPGEDCRVCVIQCPIGEAALAIDAQGKLEVRAGCTGCGVCQRACPTEPSSIVVMPAKS